MTNKPRKRAAGGGRKPKGPIRGNAGWLQARITDDLRASLEEAAKANGRSLSQEAQLRLQQSFDLPAKVQRYWGPPEVRALARLVSRTTRSVQNSVSPNPFEAGDFAWHRNAFTHAAVEAAVSTVLARFRPAGPAEMPEEAKRLWGGPNQAETVVTPESVGRSIALGVLSQLKTHREPPKRYSAGVTYGDGYYVFPDINSILGDPDDE